ncbi:MAG: hypothetical protein IPH33_12890 [Bacteroidetes bacterium]|nr:hypothetical protein [Bacteroidota bacterium]
MLDAFSGVVVPLFINQNRPPPTNNTANKMKITGFFFFGLVSFAPDLKEVASLATVSSLLKFNPVFTRQPTYLDLSLFL